MQYHYQYFHTQKNNVVPGLASKLGFLIVLPLIAIAALIVFLIGSEFLLIGGLALLAPLVLKLAGVFHRNKPHSQKQPDKQPELIEGEYRRID